MNEVKQASLVIVTVTLCLSFFVWGTIYSLRTIKNQNYHAPTPKTATQQKVQDYQNCVGKWIGKRSGKRIEACKEIVGSE